MNTSRPPIFLVFTLCAVSALLAACSSSTSGGPGTPTSNGGGKIVYMTAPLSPPAASTVIIMDSTGGSSASLGNGFVWSNASNRIVWDSTGGTDLDDGQGHATIMITTDAGTSTAVWKSTPNERLASIPVISPDGSRISFIINTPNTRRLHVFDVTANGTSITNDRSIDSNVHDKIMPSFSPDGSKIAYYSHDASNQFLTIRTTDGTLIANIPNGVDQGNIPGNVEWSPSIDKVAFGEDGVVRVVDADGSNPIVVDSGGDPAWSPDGKTIAYESPYFPGNAVTNIFLTSDLGTTKTMVPNPNRELRMMPHWSPDAQKIICSASSATGNLGVEIIDVSSGASKIIASPGIAAAWLR